MRTMTKCYVCEELKKRIQRAINTNSKLGVLNTLHNILDVINELEMESPPNALVEHYKGIVKAEKEGDNLGVLVNQAKGLLEIEKEIEKQRDGKGESPPNALETAFNDQLWGIKDRSACDDFGKGEPAPVRRMPPVDRTTKRIGPPRGDFEEPATSEPVDKLCACGHGASVHRYGNCAHCKCEYFKPVGEKKWQREKEHET
jgi:hypothetical protein